MAHTLTFSADVTASKTAGGATVNLTSPYTLQNGDVIDLSGTYELVVNGDINAFDGGEPMYLSNTDIDVTISQRAITTYGTIHYTEDEGGGSVSETWVLNETLTLSASSTFTANFVSNNTSYTSLVIQVPKPAQKLLLYDDTEVYDGAQSGVWYDESYRTVTFETAPAGDLLTWLQANGTKQASSSRVSVDLTTLSGWSAWYQTASVGSYDLTVRAKADNWQTSNPSTPVTLYIDQVTVDGVSLAEYDGVVKIVRGTEYSYTFEPFSSNYTFAGQTPEVQIANVSYTGFTWNESTGKLDIPASGVTGKIAITLKAVGKSYAVATTLTNCTSDGAATAQYGTDYVATITADTGFSLTGDGAVSPTVTIGGSAYTGFTWLPDGVGNTGSLTIPGTAITGTVAISCTAGAKSFATVYNLTGCITSSPDTHTAESDLSLVFVRSTGYRFDSTVKPSVTFTPDTAVDPVNISDLCTWTLPQAGFDTATLVVPKTYTAGTVTVTITAVKESFTVTTNLTNCTASGGATTVEYGEAWSAIITPSSGFTLEGTTPTVTIGGTPYTGFTYSAAAPSATGTTYVLRIPEGKINGDVVITIEAIGQKLAAPQNVAIDGTVVSWDEVENATSYELFADGTSIGSVKNGETWLLNERLQAFDSGDQANFDYSVNFVSNDTQYTNFACVTATSRLSKSLTYGDSDNTYTIVYNGDNVTWTNQAYRTVTFETAPTDDLLTWLQANATKQ